MSYPVLYHPSEVDFVHFGLGILKDTIQCLVTEEINGRFDLELHYPVSGALFNKINVDFLIKVDCGHHHRSKNQRFRIDRIDKSTNNIIKIFASHISKETKNFVLNPTINPINNTAHEALTMWQNNIIGAHPFTAESDIQARHSTNLSILNHPNARSALGGNSGSILDVWGGEFNFDNYHIRLLSNRGSTSNTLISYGRNLIDLKQEENISNTITSIYPFVRFQEQNVERFLTLSPNPILHSNNAYLFSHHRTLALDLSDYFENDEAPCLVKLRELAENYLLKNNIGVPKISISLKFLDLTKVLDSQSLPYERLNLCDIVPVRIEKLGIETTAKVVRVVWNVLKDEFDTIDLGDIRKTLGDKIREIERDVSIINRNTTDSILAANGKNTVFFGPSVPIGNRIGDVWYFNNGNEIILMKIWDGLGWQNMELSGDQITTGTINAANVNVINVNANSITTGILNGLRFVARGSVHDITIDEGEIRISGRGFRSDLGVMDEEELD